MKARNIKVRPDVVVHLESGDDVVILEGKVEILNDLAEYTRVSGLYKQKYGLPLLDANGQPGSDLYVFKPKTAMAWTEKDFPNTATRFIF
jgi:hypothetical protein